MSKLTESIAELCDNATSVVNTVANAKDSGALYSLFKGTRGLGDFRSTHAALWLAHGLDVPLAKAGPQLKHAVLIVAEDSVNIFIADLTAL